MAGIDGIIPTHCASRNDETAMKDAVAGTAERQLESNSADSMVLKLVNFSFFLVSP